MEPLIHLPPPPTPGIHWFGPGGSGVAYPASPPPDPVTPTPIVGIHPPYLPPGGVPGPIYEGRPPIFPGPPPPGFREPIHGFGPNPPHFPILPPRRIHPAARAALRALANYY